MKYKCFSIFPTLVMLYRTAPYLRQFIFLGVIYLEMCDALIKLALHLMSGISDTDATAMKYATASLSNMMPVPVICEKAQNYLASANTLLQHEDPDGPESGGLIEGARQLERQLTQFH